MTGPSPWAAPPETGPQQAAVFPPPPGAVPPQSGPPAQPVTPPPRQPRRRRPWLLIGGAVVVLIAVIAGTAAVTYAVARNTSSSNSTPPPTASPTPASPQPSASDQDAAKQRVCRVFDISLRGQEGKGGLVVNGELNIPIMLRRVNSVVAVENALTVETPSDVADAARRYIDTSLDVTTAATGNVPVDEGNKLNDVANKAIDALANVCGLPH